MLKRKKILQAIILPFLDYRDTHSHAPVPDLKSLDTSYHTHHRSLYRTVGWPSLGQWTKQQSQLFIYKVLIGKLPMEMNFFFNQQPETCN